MSLWFGKLVCNLKEHTIEFSMSEIMNQSEVLELEAVVGKDSILETTILICCHERNTASLASIY